MTLLAGSQLSDCCLLGFLLVHATSSMCFISYFVCYHLYMKAAMYREEESDFSIIDYLLFLVWRPISLAALDRLCHLIVALPDISI